MEIEDGSKKQAPKYSDSSNTATAILTAALDGPACFVIVVHYSRSQSYELVEQHHFLKSGGWDNF